MHNYEFLIQESHAAKFGFWTLGTVFEERARNSPWLQYLVGILPDRQTYIGERPDIRCCYDGLREIEAARFIFEQPEEKLRMPTVLDAYPSLS